MMPWWAASHAPPCSLALRGDCAHLTAHSLPLLAQPQAQSLQKQHSRWRARRRRARSCQAAVLSDASTEENAVLDLRPGGCGNGAAVAAAPPHAHPGAAVSPEELVLEPGELSWVDRAGRSSPGDVFRCPSCTEAACQVRRMRLLLFVSRQRVKLWQAFALCLCCVSGFSTQLHASCCSTRDLQTSLHTVGVRTLQGPTGCQQMLWRMEPGGYLREILTARVYDVAVRFTACSRC